MNAQRILAEFDEDIAKLQADVEKLRAARAIVNELYGGDIPPEEKSKRKYQRSAKIAPEIKTNTLPQDDSGTRSADTVGLIAVVRKLPEPFNAKNIAIAVGCSQKKAANFIGAPGLRHGWLTRVGYGQYQRTEKFPM